MLFCSIYLCISQHTNMYSIFSRPTGREKVLYNLGDELEAFSPAAPMFNEITLVMILQTPSAFGAFCGTGALLLHFPASQTSSGSYEWSVIPNRTSKEMHTYTSGPAGSSDSILVLFVQRLEIRRTECDVKSCDPFHSSIGGVCCLMEEICYQPCNPKSSF
jgi:hypothetical protein